MIYRTGRAPLRWKAMIRARAHLVALACLALLSGCGEDGETPDALPPGVRGLDANVSGASTGDAGGTSTPQAGSAEAGPGPGGNAAGGTRDAEAGVPSAGSDAGAQGRSDASGDGATGASADAAVSIMPGSMSAGCGKPGAMTGTMQATIRAFELDRGYFLSVPTSYDANVPHRLVFGYHGSNYTGRMMRSYTFLDSF
jgi:hypothetical protein